MQNNGRFFDIGINENCKDKINISTSFPSKCIFRYAPLTSEYILLVYRDEKVRTRRIFKFMCFRLRGISNDIRETNICFYLKKKVILRFIKSLLILIKELFLIF